MSCQTALCLSDRLDSGLLEKSRGYLPQCSQLRSKQQLKPCLAATLRNCFAAHRGFRETIRMLGTVDPAGVKATWRKIKHSSHIRTQTLLFPSWVAGTKIRGKFGVSFV